MRPTIAEQLRETRRILNDLLRSQISDGYSVQIITMLLANIEMLETAWVDILPFLHWDNGRVEELLRAIHETLPATLTAEVEDVLGAPRCEPFDVTALEARNDALRALLTRVTSVCDASGRRHIQAYMLERTSRYPMRPRAAALANARPAKEA